MDLREQRASLISRARAINDATGNREMTAEDERRFERLMKDANRLGQRIDMQDRATLSRAVDIIGSNGDGAFVSAGMQRVDLRSKEWAKVARTNTPSYEKGFVDWMGGGQSRALQVDSDTSGGYLVAPIKMVDSMLGAVQDAVYMRQWATVFALPQAQSLGVPTLENEPADPVWTAEIATGDEDSTMSFGQRQLFPHPLAKRIKVSNTLLQRAPNADGIVVEALANKFAAVMENAFLNGNGSGQPLGVFTASDDGIPTSRDVSTDNTTTSMTADGLISAKYALKPAYHRRAKWMFHPDALLQIAKLKDGDGQYLWRESVRTGEPDKLLGLPVFMSEYAPSTFTTGLYVGILGDFTNYWIADALDMNVQRLIELYAVTNQTGFIGRMESDGMPAIPEAFVRVQLA